MKYTIFELLCYLEKNSNKLLNKLKKKIDPFKYHEHTNEFKTAYSTIGGIDLKFYIEDEDTPVFLPLTVVPSVQSIQFTKNNTGTLTCCFFDSIQPFHKFLGTTKHLIIKGANGEGKITTLFDGIVKFGTCLQWETSIDEIVIEVELSFIVMSQKLQIQQKQGE